jgi:pimeloyl-ACP methyl ester carboxylesterase
VKARTALVAAGLATGAAAIAGYRRRQRAEASTEGEPLQLPDGEDRVVTSTDGAKLHVRVAGPEGAAQTFALAHCWTCDRRTWGPVARRLVDHGHRVALWDHRGHGQSTVGDDGFTLEALGADVRAVLEGLDLADVVLAGHSMGGMAAQAFLVGHPDARKRVAGLALVATGCGRLSPRWFKQGERLLVRALADRNLARLMAYQRVGIPLVRVASGRRPVHAHLDAVRETFLATSPEARGRFMTAILAMDFAAALADVDVPAVVVVGSRDLMTPPPRARALAAALPGSRLEVIPGAGHMLPLEAPDRLAEVIESLALPATFAS